MVINYRMTRTGNLLHPLTPQNTTEQIDTLLTRPGARIERIVSTGQASAEGFWYDQDEDEFVLILSGAAGVRIAGEAAMRELRPGDWLEIPAHMRHRVEWTVADAPTVWLAVFISPQATPRGTIPRAADAAEN